MLLKKAGLISVALFSTQVALAEAGNIWKGEGELGFSSSTGNTENESLNTKLSISREYEKWIHGVTFSALRGKDNDTTTAERYVFNARSEYKLSELNYLFGAFRYDDDRFGGYDYQTSLVAGVGRHIIKTEATSLKLEIGAGARRSQLKEMDAVEDETSLKEKVDFTESSRNEGIVQSRLNFSHSFTKTTAFIQDFLIETGKENTYIESDTGLRVSISDHLALKVSFAMKRNTTVPEGKEKIDKVSTVNLVYSF